MVKISLIWWKTSALVAILIAAFAFYLRSTTAPVRVLPTSEFIHLEAQNPIALDKSIQDFVTRAQHDYFIHPVDFRSPRELVFGQALRVPPNDLYLVFYLKKSPSDFLIFYRVARENGRLLWKAGVPVD